MNLYQCLYFAAGLSQPSSAEVKASSAQKALTTVVKGRGCYITAVVFADDPFAEIPSGYPILAWSGHADDYHEQDTKESQIMSLNMDRVAELENYLCDIVRNDPDDSIDQREQLVLYIVGLEERIDKLERRLDAKPGF